jgi:TPR repeat protein
MGMGVNQDDKKAFKLIKSAAAQGVDMPYDFPFDLHRKG